MCTTPVISFQVDTKRNMHGWIKYIGTDYSAGTELLFRSSFASRRRLTSSDFVDWKSKLQNIGKKQSVKTPIPITSVEQLVETMDKGYSVIYCCYY